MSKLIELVEEFGLAIEASENNRVYGVERLQQKLDDEADAIFAELRAAVQELEMDAARYRYLRDPEQPDNIVTVQNYYGRERHVLLSADEMDKAIDAAMEAAK